MHRQARIQEGAGGGGGRARIRANIHTLAADMS